MSQARCVSPSSAANPLPKALNSAAGGLEQLVFKLLISLYHFVQDGQFLDLTTRISPAGRGMASGHEGRLLGGAKDELKARRAARDRDGAGAGHLGQPQRLHQRDEGVELLARPGQLEDKALGRRIDHTCAED